MFTVDLRETLNVVAVRIFTHNNGRPVSSIEVEFNKAEMRVRG